jgi:GMP synthase (glutamine-hydrolysing)
MKCLALRHLAFEDLGTFAPLLQQRGFDIDYRDAGIDPITAADEADADVLVVLGGPIGVYDSALYPWLHSEIDVVRRRLRDARPLLGICLGAQLMAAAMGARVYASGSKEIGWAPVALSAAGAVSPLRHLADTAVLHWHGDTFDVPAGATMLASTATTPHQAFSVGRHALALQFHAEVNPARFEAWLVGHASELGQSHIDVAALRAAGAHHGAAQAHAGAALLGEWLASH